MEYTQDEKEVIIKKYLNKYEINTSDEVIKKISEKVGAVPREIHNLCIKIRDFVITHGLSSFAKGGGPLAVEDFKNHILTELLREDFLKHSQIDDGGMTPLHAKYLEILEKADRPMGVRAIAVQLGINEKAVEEDVEPLLLKLGKIEKSGAGRILIS
ncbi:MAG: Holliday junction DNA helicase RuvB C-terminal domain-containing protein [bacterium]